MDTDLVTGTPDTNVFDAVSTLGDAGVRRLPIVGEDGRLEGIVTLDDLIVLLGSEMGNATEVIKQQSTRY
jgi:CBS domain-containing protein